VKTDSFNFVIPLPEPLNNDVVDFTSISTSKPKEIENLYNGSSLHINSQPSPAIPTTETLSSEVEPNLPPSIEEHSVMAAHRSERFHSMGEYNTYSRESPTVTYGGSPKPQPPPKHRHTLGQEDKLIQLSTVWPVLEKTPQVQTTLDDLKATGLNSTEQQFIGPEDIPVQIQPITPTQKSSLMYSHPTTVVKTNITDHHEKLEIENPTKTQNEKTPAKKASRTFMLSTIACIVMWLLCCGSCACCAFIPTFKYRKAQDQGARKYAQFGICGCILSALMLLCIFLFVCVPVAAVIIVKSIEN